MWGERKARRGPSAAGRWLLVGLCLIGCPGSSVTSVVVTSDRTTLVPMQVATLAASVLGSGDFVPTVTWSIDGGGLGLVANGLSATYTAPVAEPRTTIVIRATTTEDTSVSGTVTLTISR